MIRHILLATALLLSGMHHAEAQKRSKQAKKPAVEFLEDIEVSIIPPAAEVQPLPAPKPVDSSAPVFSGGSGIEDVPAIQIKYALILDAEVEQLHNTALLNLIEEWWNTPYRLGGTDKKGIDCSAFTQLLYRSAYGISLPRTSRDQYRMVSTVTPSELREGDLIFFARGGTISHVGFYLHNNKFVHASTSEGVTVSDLNDQYWSKRFVGVGRPSTGTASLGSPARP